MTDKAFKDFENGATGVHRLLVNLGAIGPGGETVYALLGAALLVAPDGTPVDLAQAEDSAHSSGDSGIMALAVRQDAAAALAAAGDYIPLIADANGRLYVNVAALGQALMAASLPVVIASDYGVIATPTHTAVNVTAVSGVALAANAARLYVLFINDSDEVIYLKLGAAAVANQGIRLNADGGSYEMSAAEGNLYLGAINAIHGGAGNKVLTVLEGV